MSVAHDLRFSSGRPVAPDLLSFQDNTKEKEAIRRAEVAEGRVARAETKLAKLARMAESGEPIDVCLLFTTRVICSHLAASVTYTY